MISVGSLAIPILISAVFVFLASWLVHMLLPFHRGDFKKVPGEDELMDAHAQAQCSARRLHGPAWRWP